ncbi:hypothetical protein GCM10010300_77510 [Streptomyces olivaceoviridis]|uniref:hypothetical protein n=1 Tax=Streptomyces olivaceoviridis TaxID=1921 RepID=UPI001675ADBC|nr:hypothetical protein [Streptomyces olivaceoviridis]GGZ22271.1 hypothetical protein GCM10010300_77510 [Streptomyces olivaceoviridis]
MPANPTPTPLSSTQPDPDIAHLARTRELPDQEAFQGLAYDIQILNEINLYVRQLGLPIPVRPSAPALLTILRHAEQHSGGYQRHLIGYAAANLDAATWIGQESEEGRLRLATALDYLARAAGISAPRHRNASTSP